MAYMLKEGKIIKVKIKSEDVELNSIRFYDNYYHIPYLTLFFDFKTNIQIQNEIFEVKGFFTKDFDFNMDETEDELNLHINMDALSEKAIDNIFTIEEYIRKSLTDIELEEDKSERFFLKHKYLNREIESYLNIHRCYMESHNRPILSYDYNTRNYTAELTDDLLDYLKKFYNTDFGEFERINKKRIPLLDEGLKFVNMPDIEEDKVYETTWIKQVGRGKLGEDDD